MKNEIPAFSTEAIATLNEVYANYKKVLLDIVAREEGKHLNYLRAAADHIESMIKYAIDNNNAPKDIEYAYQKAAIDLKIDIDTLLTIFQCV